MSENETEDIQELSEYTDFRVIKEVGTQFINRVTLFDVVTWL